MIEWLGVRVLIFPILLLLIAVTLGTAMGDDSVKIEGVWARASISPNGAVYLTVRNTGTAPDVVVDARAVVSERVEIHSHTMTDGMMRMRRVDGVELPAGSAVQFEPGGYHIMLIRLKKPLREGDRFPLTLVLEKAGEVTAEVAVGSVRAKGPVN